MKIDLEVNGNSLKLEVSIQRTYMYSSILRCVYSEFTLMNGLVLISIQ